MQKRLFQSQQIRAVDDANVVGSESNVLEVIIVLIFQPYIKTTDRNATDITNDIYIIIIGSGTIGIFIIIKYPTLQQVLELVIKALQEIESQLCSKEYRFDKGYCYWFEPCIINPCQNGGNCVVNIQRKPTCLCSEDDEHTYSGANCENKTSKLFSDLKYIAAAAAGWFAAVVLIIVVICCICRQKKGDKKAQYDNENIHEHETLSYNHPMGLLGRQRVPSNFYLTNASKDDSYFIDYGRRHTYLEENMDNSDVSIIHDSTVQINEVDRTRNIRNQTFSKHAIFTIMAQNHGNLSVICLDFERSHIIMCTHRVPES
ncbi:unnamed protein product [Mytilus coruscus]|uniref:EGF-like domain-containing protein n=1 Tax=Mytilus coruscus TaxID=42192 RepID=A0A6J8EZA2_MYTCO|nr:unnamed protein product [Mytilus coruscus]